MTESPKPDARVRAKIVKALKALVAGDDAGKSMMDSDMLDHAATVCAEYPAEVLAIVLGVATRPASPAPVVDRAAAESPKRWAKVTPNGWQTADAQGTYGPVFHSVGDLWAWQRENPGRLAPGAPAKPDPDACPACGSGVASVYLSGWFAPARLASLTPAEILDCIAGLTDSTCGRTCDDCGAQYP